MKYKILKDLPFIKTGEIFGKGCWVGGGWGVDLGESKFSGGGSASNGVRTFEDFENKMLDRLLLNKDWVRMLPESAHELLNLYEEGYYKKNEILDLICLKPGGVR